MNNLILSLRNFSLRITILLTFVLLIVVGSCSIGSSGGMKITAVLTAVASALMYMTIAVHSIDDDDKAVKVSYVMLFAYVVSLFNALTRDFPDIGDFFSIMFDEGGIEGWTYNFCRAAAPYALLMNVLMTGALIWGIRDVNKKFTVAWYVALIGYGISCISTFLLFSDNCDYGVYTSISNVGNFFGIMQFVILLFIGGRTKRQTAQSLCVSSEIPVDSRQPAEPTRQQDWMEGLASLKELLDSGVLTQEEFDEEKRKILNAK